MKLLQIEAVVLTLATLLPINAGAQTINQGLIQWELFVLETAPVQGSFLSYGERRHLEVSFVISNNSQSPVLVDTARIVGSFSLQVIFGSSQVPTTVKWDTEMGAPFGN